MVRMLAATVVSLLVFSGPALAAEPGDEDLPGVGADAPGFTLPVYNNEAAAQARAGTMLLVGDDADDKDTRLILVSFMASHCKPCKKELPVLQQMFERYKGNGLRIIGVAIDSEAEGQKAVADILKENKITFPVAKDGYNFVARRYLGNKVPLPSVFLVSRAGKITFVSRGYSEEISKKMTSMVAKGLGLPPPPEPAPEPVVDPKAKPAKTPAKTPAKKGATK